MSKEPESKEAETTKRLDPFSALNTVRDASMQAWSKMMIDFVNSEAYSEATAQWLDTYLTMSQPFQRFIETTMTQVLTRLNMPVRTDVISLAERLTNIEMRLDDLDARLDDILHAIQALSSSHQTADASSSSRAEDTSTPRAKVKAKEAH